MIPEGWLYESLEQHINIKHGFAFKSEYFASQGFHILLTPGNFKEEGGFRLIEEKRKYYTGQIPEGYILAKHDLLVAMTEQAPGLLGSAILIPEDKKYLHNQRLGLIKIKNSKIICKYFLYFVFNSWLTRTSVSATASGTKVKHTSPQKICDLIIPIPPLLEQRKIAEILSTWDKAIALLEQLITAKRKLKQGLMQQLLTGKKRFKEFEGSEWEVKKLENISSEIGDGIHATPEYVESSVFYFVNGNNVINQSIQINKKTKCVSEEEYRRYRKNLSNKTILMSINGTIGNIGFFNNENVILGKSIAYINIKNIISKEYIFYFLQSHAINCYFENELTGSTIRNLSLKSIRNAPILVPSNIAEQQKIASILSAADTEISNLEKQLAAYKQQKRGLMQQLLTGKKRVKLDEPQMQKV